LLLLSQLTAKRITIIGNTMSMTSLFVELVVTGIHTCIVIGIIILAFTGYQNVKLNEILNLNLAIPLLALAYIIGILVDRFADQIVRPHDQKLRSKYIPEDYSVLHEMRYYIASKSNDIYDELEYIRIRMRIARSAIVNFALTTLSVVLFIIMQYSHTTYLVYIYLLVAVVLGVFLTYLSYKSWVGLTESYIRSTLIAYKILEKQEDNKKTSGIPQVHPS
jgi:hypothetical protein